MSEVADEEAAEGGQVAGPPGVVKLDDSEVLETLLEKAADMGWKLWPPAPVKGISVECDGRARIWDAVADAPSILISLA